MHWSERSSKGVLPADVIIVTTETQSGEGTGVSRKDRSAARRVLFLIAIVFPTLALLPVRSAEAGRHECPLAFEANRGQAEDEVRFLASGARYTAFFTATDSVLLLDDGERRAIVRLRPFGANRAPRVIGEHTLPGARRDPSTRSVTTATDRTVRYVDVYPGIDLVYHGNRDQLEYDFVVAPRAEPGHIALAMDGVERLTVDAAGTLVAHTAARDVRQPPPVVYQEIDGVRHR